MELLQAQDVVRVHSPANYRCADTADGSQYSAHALLLARRAVELIEGSVVGYTLIAATKE